MTPDQQKIAAVLAPMHLPVGMGDEHNACSIAAINLALTGCLTDERIPCVSDVIRRWVITIQDAMPDEMRNSAAWKGQLPYLAGTGQDHESGRAAIILDHMWTVTLPLLQPLADANGFGEPWRTMCRERTAEAAEAARAAAWAAKAAWVAKAARTAARAAAWAAAEAAEAAARAAEAAARAAAWAAAEAAWQTIDPCGLLKRLIAVGGEA